MAKIVDLSKVGVSVTAIGAAFVLVITVVWSVVEWKTALDANTEAVRDLQDYIRSTWTAADQERWVRTFRLLNPGVTVPDPK